MIYSGSVTFAATNMVSGSGNHCHEYVCTLWLYLLHARIFVIAICAWRVRPFHSITGLQTVVKLASIDFWAVHWESHTEDHSFQNPHFGVKVVIHMQTIIKNVINLQKKTKTIFSRKYSFPSRDLIYMQHWMPCFAAMCIASVICIGKNAHVSSTSCQITEALLITALRLIPRRTWQSCELHLLMPRAVVPRVASSVMG